MYTKQTWADGDIITAAKLNHIEQGIADAECNLFLVTVTEVLDGAVFSYTVDMTFAEVMAEMNNGHLPLYEVTRTGGDVYYYFPLEYGAYITITGDDNGLLVHDSTGVHVSAR